MKRGIIALYFLALVSLIGIVGAANTCSNPSQIILKLTADSNAHGGVWDAIGNYPTEICYNQIFSGSAARGSCDGNNLILSLSKPTNAHAEGPAENTPGYDTYVCYGELTECSLETGVNCPPEKGAIVRLSKNKNAHLALASYTNYNNVICCKPPTSVKVCNCLPGQICKSSGDCEEVSATCGNGFKEGTEECDDGNNADGDGCSPTCINEEPGAVCGNGFVELGEECDDGNNADGDGCSPTCISEIVPPASGDAYWATDSGNKYSDGATVSVLTPVKLVAKGASVGQLIDFKIYRQVGGFLDPLIPDGSSIKDFDDVVVDGSETAITPVWSIPSSEVGRVLYFTAKEGLYDEQSPKLIVTNIIKDSCDDYSVSECEGASITPVMMNGVACSSCVVKSGECKLNCEETSNGCKKNCYYSDVITAACADDMMEISYDAEFETSLSGCTVDPIEIAALAEEMGCVSGVTQIPCGAPELQLPFFGITQFIIGMLGIAGIYALIIWKRERERGE